ncbi:hypothetical protein FHS19_002558 [Paenibacillus rhizosphaerae]|uniref:Uncharacterized protein n=1 Tax=Paenibacillus rhizosphaerae TaxID=297318 RepID=A0A839TM13_9BACL|nr:hypothetical protein [Paenibacillus rhizosphaerae]MBB3127904.1 hypothetical protein [Paenibacillus rhizosphaerae]
MNQHAESMISVSIAFILFISACIFALGLTGELNRAVKEAGHVAQGQLRSVQPALESSHQDWVSGSQVVFSMMGLNDPDVRISVDGANVTGGPWEDGFDFSMIDTGAVYSIVYEWSVSGELIGINFAKSDSKEQTSHE